MKLLPLLLFLFCLATFAEDNHALRTYHLVNPDQRTLDAVASEFEIVKRLPDGFEVYVHEAREQRFRSIAPKARPVAEPKLDKASLDGYRNFTQVEAELAALAARYPHIAKLESYGEAGGLKLYALKVSDNVAMDEDEPELMITSATHGDEIITVEVEMELLGELLRAYGTDARLSKMVDERELYFIPVVNPQGYSRRDRYAGGFTDPNRDYPWPEKPERASVECIAALRRFFHSRDIKGSIDLHAYGKLVMFPWAYTVASPGEDESVFQLLGNAMAEVNRYEVGQISKIIYVAKGSSADYYYWKNKTIAYGIELATSKAPPFSTVPAIVNESREMIWRFIEHF